MSEEINAEKNKRTLTVYYNYQKNHDVPLIRLQGKWLENLGFYVGNQVEVEEEKGLLLIRAIQNDQAGTVYYRTGRNRR